MKPPADRQPRKFYCAELEAYWSGNEKLKRSTARINLEFGIKTTCSLTIVWKEKNKKIKQGNREVENNNPIFQRSKSKSIKQRYQSGDFVSVLPRVKDVKLVLDLKDISQILKINYPSSNSQTSWKKTLSNVNSFKNATGCRLIIIEIMHASFVLGLV